jgi:aryl-alcohol dehydrogenase-like predicted oxidoreductase
MSENANDCGLSRKHIMESIDKTLARIGTDYLDLYFCHRWDPEVGVEEVVRAMDDLVRQGKVLYWGTSVWEADQIDAAVGAAGKCLGCAPAVEQPRYNMIDRHIEDAILPTCDRHGMGLVVWSPLAQGLLTGKYNKGVPDDSRGATTDWLANDLTDENIARAIKISEIAGELNITPAQLALAWILRRPEITSAITGATSIEQVRANVAACGVELDETVIKRIEVILDGDEVA